MGLNTIGRWIAKTYAAPNTSAKIQIRTLPTLTAAYNQAMHAKDWPAALADVQKLAALSPTAENLRLLGNVQSNSRAPQDALATYDKALAAAEAEKPAEGQPDAAWKDEKSKILLAKGNAYLRLKRNSDAIALYTKAAPLAEDPGTATFNICATYYNLGDTQNAVPACRKAAAVSPANANVWFVLGSLLFAESNLDAKGNIAITSECRETLEKYLKLVPDGPHAADVKAMLNMGAR